MPRTAFPYIPKYPAYSHIDSRLSALNIDISPRNYYISNTERLSDLPDDEGGLYIIYREHPSRYLNRKFWSPYKSARHIGEGLLRQSKYTILYVGVTQRTLRQRITEHMQSDNKDWFIGSDIMYYPLNYNKTRLAKLEQEVIRILKPIYNQSGGGEGLTKT